MTRPVRKEQENLSPHPSVRTPAADLIIGRPFFQILKLTTIPKGSPSDLISGCVDQQWVGQ